MAQSDFERYKADLEAAAGDGRAVDWSMERAAQDGELTGEQFDELMLIALRCGQARRSGRKEG